MVAIERGADAVDDEPVVIPAIVYGELLLGVALTTDPVRAAERRAKVAAVVATCPIVEFDQALTERWAGVVGQLRQRGESIPSNDAQVAATALELGFTVLVGSADEQHFRRVPGLAVRALHI